MKAQGAIVALSGKIAKNRKPYTMIEIENGVKVWCWDNKKLAGFSMGDLVEIEATDEEYPRLEHISKLPVQKDVQTFFTPPAGAVPMDSKQASSAAPASGTSEILTRLDNLEKYFLEVDRLYLSKLFAIQDLVAQQAATIQTTAGQVAAIKRDTETLIDITTTTEETIEAEKED